MSIVAVIALVFATAPAICALKCYEKTLPNGLRMVVCPDPSLRLAAVDIWVRAGSAFERAGEVGAAHFLEHVVFKGTPTYPPGKMDEKIENVGATLNAGTSRDWAHFHTTIAIEYVGTALDLLADAIQHPQFDPAEVGKERNVVVAEIQGRRTDPIQIIDEALAAAVYGEHPYGRPVYGGPETVHTVTTDTLRAFHRRLYVGPSMVAAVVGNVDPEAVFAELSARFSSVPGGTEAEWPPAPSPPEPKSIDLPKAAAGAEWLAMGFLGPGIAAPEDVWAMDVLTACLAREGAGLLHDRLVVNDRTARAVDTGFLTMKLPAMVSIALASADGKLDANAQALKEEIEKIRLGGVSAAELAAARRYLLGTYAFQIETASGLTGSLGFYGILSSVQDSLNYTTAVQAVTAEDVRRVALTYLDPAKAVVVRLSQ